MSGKHFSELGLSPETLKVISQDLKFERATPVQEATIPLFCGNKDVSVDACTGSGKTLAFVVPIIEKLRRISKPLKRHQVGAIVISPTRELSQQIFDVAEYFIGTIEWASLALLVGGRYGQSVDNDDLSLIDWQRLQDSMLPYLVELYYGDIVTSKRIFILSSEILKKMLVV